MLAPTGFRTNTNGLYIVKDPEAKLAYVFDWSEWLTNSDVITASEYSLQVRANDPTPLVKVQDGHTDTTTYIELQGGGAKKSYLVTVKVTTQTGIIDRRNFRIQVEDRSA